MVISHSLDAQNYYFCTTKLGQAERTDILVVTE